MKPEASKKMGIYHKQALANTYVRTTMSKTKLHCFITKSDSAKSKFALHIIKKN